MHCHRNLSVTVTLGFLARVSGRSVMRVFTREDPASALGALFQHANCGTRERIDATVEQGEDEGTQVYATPAQA